MAVREARTTGPNCRRAETLSIAGDVDTRYIMANPANRWCRWRKNISA